MLQPVTFFLQVTPKGSQVTFFCGSIKKGHFEEAGFSVHASCSFPETNSHRTWNTGVSWKMSFLLGSFSTFASCHVRSASFRKVNSHGCTFGSVKYHQVLFLSGRSTSNKLVFPSPKISHFQVDGRCFHLLFSLNWGEISQVWPRFSPFVTRTIQLPFYPRGVHRSGWSSVSRLRSRRVLGVSDRKDPKWQWIRSPVSVWDAPVLKKKRILKGHCS